jgi:outer membrane autotransporter protein
MGRPELIEFDTSAPYYGAHLGLGYLWNLSAKTSLDLYGKYMWARQEGDTVTLTLGDRVKFKAIDTHRLQGGFRLTRDVTEKASPYIGAAYDYGVDSSARATPGYHQHDIESHSLDGGTWMGELGVKFKPTAALPVVLDLGLQGYTGIREGITGSIQFRVEF